MPRIAFLGLTGMYGNQVSRRDRACTARDSPAMLNAQGELTMEIPVGCCRRCCCCVRRAAQVLYIMGLDLTNSDFAAIMQQATPVITCLIAVVIGVERLTLRKGAGIAICVSGALLMVGLPGMLGRRSAPTQENTVLGALVLLGNTLCSAVYMIAQKPLLQRYPPLSLTAWSYGFGAALMGGTSVYYHADASVWHVSDKAALALSFAVLFNSAAKYSLNSFANKHVSSTVVQLWATMATVLTALFAWVLIGTRPQKQYVWGLAILVGLFMVVLDRAREPFELKQGARSADGPGKAAAAERRLADVSGEEGHASAGSGDETDPLLVAATRD